MTGHRCVLPDEHLFLRLPNGSLKAVEAKPNTIIEINRLGNIPTSYILGRPYHHTFELLEKKEGEQHSRLRLVTPVELEAERAAGDAGLEESRNAPTDSPADANGEEIDLVTEEGKVVVKNNRLIIDDGNRQTLTHEEIEALKKSSGGREVVEKILANHTALDEKTAFSRAKYTLRKTRKYLKRFTLLPMELGLLIEYVLEKEPPRIMELREESLALVTSWSNAHWNSPDDLYDIGGGELRGDGRLLVVDDAGGLIVAGLAERKGILRATHNTPAMSDAQPMEVDGEKSTDTTVHKDFPLPAKTNSLTLLHSAIQPNVSLLKYFGYDTNHPDQNHPLHTHLRSLSWLQLLHPEEDPLYQEPETMTEEVVQSWKPGKRGTYYKKRRRWERCKAISDEARAGGFDGLIIATHMDLTGLLSRTLPLLRGGAQVVIYSPNVEPLAKVVDLYSKDRRAAYNALRAQDPDSDPPVEDFPLDPRLLLAPTLQTSRVREYQVLPGRTHPLMTSRGGSEGYVLTARRVLPLAGNVEARGHFGRKRKAGAAVSA
ncbi:hypothetical protein AMS68_005054 [Peltaster fructicola]|uniref:tRNA (adenine(58)-N(1))-methyltransferase non-catalytic subunit TRM6 n=1 Tax=Peltaster fructicola TaxID=286661 RepID=A0A6H0XXN7_9PEZI|nr:hypothetical protein AMS68_005054 [Peltaster fructicola]